MASVKYIAIILTFFLQFAEVSAQETADKYEVSGAYHFGFILSHRNDINVLVKGYTRGVELTFTKRFDGKNDWEQKFSYPYLGGSFVILDFSNPEQLGRGYGLLAFYDFPLNHGKKFEGSFKIGFGPGYIEKVYDRIENFKNYGISTYINGFAHANFRAKYHFRKHIEANVGFGIFHFSNASYKKPNLGINIPVINAGVGYSFMPQTKYPRKEKSEYHRDKKWYQDIVLAYGAKERNPIGGRKYDILTTHYDISRHVSYKCRFGLGADLFYNSALRGEVNAYGDSINATGDIFQGGVHASFIFQVSKLSMFIHCGRYLRDKYLKDGLMYNRFGIRYAFNEHFLLNLSMKTHMAIADHVEYGIGYRF